MTILIESTRRDGVMKPGEWRSVELVVVCCPQCGKKFPLQRYVIDPDGTVTPSLDCPFEHCDFHEMVKLADWKA